MFHSGRMSVIESNSGDLSVFVLSRITTTTNITVDTSVYRAVFLFIGFILL